MSQEGSKPVKKFKDTLNLPKTTMPIIYDFARIEPSIINSWQQSQIYNRTFWPKDFQLTAAERDKVFVLHDGPPYANGPIHLGHALNNVLKDIVVKYQKMLGKKIHFRLGWDCHGLPIEKKVADLLQLNRVQASAQAEYFMQECRKYAAGWIEVQKQERVRLGVIADSENSYATMDYGYQANIVRAFGRFVEKGLISRRNKAVPWCLHCQTTLAQAEIEHRDKTSPSTYLYFWLTQASKEKLAAMVQATLPEKMAFLVWTTTPWTLPLNRGLMLHPDTEYVLLQAQGDHAIGFWVAKDLATKVCQLLRIPMVVLAQLHSQQLLGLLVKHPTDANATSPVIADATVGLEDGTAVVHCAPGCGPEDYLAGIKNQLEIFSPVDAQGCYLPAAGIADALVGRNVLEAQGWVINFLKEEGSLVLQQDLFHSYPHCWRCRQPLIFRATPQWFCDLAADWLQQKLKAAVEAIDFVPVSGKVRFQSCLGTRPEWCISRQRTWGVPIVSLLCQQCNAPYCDSSFINKVADAIEKDSITMWRTLSMAQVKEYGWIAQDMACQQCGGTSWRKEEDILDVWFESGVSNFAVLATENPLLLPADLYLEGSDQHRAWFQSSTICSLVLNDLPPMKTIVTHGFLVDENHNKMSKSLGNGIEPSAIINQYGADVLRLWVACSDFTTDIALSMPMLSVFAEMHRKIRNSCRFLISNQVGFSRANAFVLHGNVCNQELMLALPLFLTELNAAPVINGVEVVIGWSLIDRLLLHKLCQLGHKVLESYAKYEFTQVVSKINHFCATELSSKYLDVCKDRLYTEATNGPLRKATQIVFTYTLDCLQSWMAPVLPFLAEEIGQYAAVAGEVPSMVLEHNFKDPVALERLLQAWDAKFAKHFVSAQENSWPLEDCLALLEQLREQVLLAIEKLRELGSLRQGVEASVTLYIDNRTAEGLLLNHLWQALAIEQGAIRFLTDWCIVGKVTLAATAAELHKTVLPWLHIKAEVIKETRCIRCWRFNDMLADQAELCNRCNNVILECQQVSAE